MTIVIPVLMFLVAHWDSILVGAGFALAFLAVIAKHTKNTVDDEIVATAEELLQVAKTVPAPRPVQLPTPPPVPASLAANVESVVETAGEVFDVVDKVAPAVTAPVKQGAALVGVLAGLAKVFTK